MAARRRIALTLALAALALLGVLAPSASASFHLMSVREVATNPAGADSAFIELQMYSPGQSFVAGHSVTFYTATGSVLATFALTASVPNGDNQRTILIGDTATAGSPDFTYPALSDAIQTYGPAGAACFETIDCVSWGAFTGAALLPSAPGSPAPAIPDGSSLERSITPGCATLLEAGDDTNNSSADLSLATPSPRNNSVTPTEKACGGGGGGDNQAPETEITKGPPNRSEKATAKFRFNASEQGSKFQCKLDKGSFKTCDSPQRYRRLDSGKHKFQVFATDAAGNEDRSPAIYRFKVVE